jgi:hypothetical protein
MKKMLLNLTALAIIAGGGSMLNAQVAPPIRETCTAGNGASCSGTNCCADATTCWSSC